MSEPDWEAMVNDLPHVRIEKAEKRIKQLESALREIDLTLTVPAAEYVPAIGDVFKIIDRMKVKP